MTAEAGTEVKEGTAAETPDTLLSSEPSGAEQETGTEQETLLTANEDKTEAEASETEEVKEAEGAPESYTFAVPDGVSLPDTLKGAVEEASREANLTQEAAQGYLDTVLPAFIESQRESLEATGKEWADQSRADKEFGGEKFDAALGDANKFLSQFGTPELGELLNRTRLGNHPEVIRAFHKAARAISSDRLVADGASSSTEPSEEERVKSFYTNSQMN